MNYQKPYMPPTRKESLRFNFGRHVRDYHSTLKYEGANTAEQYKRLILLRLEQLGGLAGRW